MSFLTGCGTQQENTANSQTIPKAAVSSDTVKEIARTGMSTAVPDIYLQPIEQAGTVTQITYDSKDFVRDESVITNGERNGPVDKLSIFLDKKQKICYNREGK